VLVKRKVFTEDKKIYSTGAIVQLINGTASRFRGWKAAPTILEQQSCSGARTTQVVHRRRIVEVVTHFRKELDL
jgi:hypothetical protein